MRNLFLVLAFMLTSSFAFANNNLELPNSSFEETSELVKTSNHNEQLISKIVIKELLRFDHCTITVSTVDSDGNVTSSVTVTNYDADCTAAKNLAYRILGLL